MNTNLYVGVTVMIMITRITTINTTVITITGVADIIPHWYTAVVVVGLVAISKPSVEVGQDTARSCSGARL